MYKEQPWDLKKLFPISKCPLMLYPCWFTYKTYIWGLKSSSYIQMLRTSQFILSSFYCTLYYMRFVCFDIIYSLFGTSKLVLNMLDFQKHVEKESLQLFERELISRNPAILTLIKLFDRPLVLYNDLLHAPIKIWNIFIR